MIIDIRSSTSLQRASTAMLVMNHISEEVSNPPGIPTFWLLSSPRIWVIMISWTIRKVWILSELVYKLRSVSRPLSSHWKDVIMIAIPASSKICTNRWRNISWMKKSGYSPPALINSFASWFSWRFFYPSGFTIRIEFRYTIPTSF